MKSTRLLFAFVAAAGMFATATPSSQGQFDRACASGSDARPDATAAGAVPAPRTGDDASMVQVALERFDSALALRDVMQLQAAGVKPGDARRWQSFFRHNPQASVTDSCPATALYISGDTANWVCVERATILSEGKPFTHAQSIRFTFTRVSGGWLVSERR